MDMLLLCSYEGVKSYFGDYWQILFCEAFCVQMNRVAFCHGVAAAICHAEVGAKDLRRAMT
jgi:hypothetical protein